MPAKRGERKETNDKKTLLISLLIAMRLASQYFLYCFQLPLR